MEVLGLDLLFGSFGVLSPPEELNLLSGRTSSLSSGFNMGLLPERQPSRAGDLSS